MPTQREKPIIFSSEMVRAILEGRKTVTRRVIVPQPKIVHGLQPDGILITEQIFRDGRQGLKCPYQVGDRLWVREAFVLESDAEYGYTDAELKQFNRPIKTEDGGDEYGHYHLIPHYRATEPEPNIVSMEQDSNDDTTKWRPSIFMPRWASRITLEVTEVRVEQLSQITEEDALSEGFSKRIYFLNYWDKLNMARGFSQELNPYVWRIEFKKL